MPLTHSVHFFVGTLRAFGTPLNSGVRPYNMRSLIFVVLLSLSFAAHAADRSSMQLHVGGGINGTGPNFSISLRGDGRLRVKRTSLPIVPPGKLSETNQDVRLTKAETASIIRAAEAADDFAIGCTGMPDGVSATLVIQYMGKTTKRECWSSPRWPNGLKTRNLVNQINSHLAKKFQIE